MPLLEGFEFLRMGFEVSYHASLEPQLLHIEVTTLERSLRRSAPIIVKRLIELINAGAACGSMFRPQDSFAERVNGPWDGPDAFGPDFRWTLRVRGVAPLFLRTIVDQVRKCGHDQPVTTMRIRSETPGRDVDTKTMLRWLERADAYVEECLDPGFPVVTSTAPQTSFTVALSTTIDEDAADTLKQIAMRWLIATASYVDDDGKPVVRSRAEIERHLPAFEVYGGRLIARFERFLHAAEPSRAVLVNMLARAKADGLPIVSVELTHPRFAGGEYVAAPKRSPKKKKKAPVKKKRPAAKKKKTVPQKKKKAKRR